MRFESVTAHKFGPFTEQTLELTRGFNIIYGPNEAGKSSWHAALYAGLCGIRRSQGRPTQQDQQFDDRHRPWDEEDWEVSATIALEDGRRVQLYHDLKTRIGHAYDATLGRECTNEIMHDGAPDGSRWLGLDRRSFLATACVRQADLLGVLKDSGVLQEYLQRAATTAGADSTAAAALDRIAEFLSEKVGSDRANSTKPLRRAINRLDETKRALEQAQQEHAEYLELAAKVEASKTRADKARRWVTLVKTAKAKTEAAKAERQLQRARELSEQYPAAPSIGVTDDALAQEAAAALHFWAERPDVPVLQGPSADELRSQLEALPAMPEGDLEVAPEVAKAAEARRDARLLLQQHDDQRPERIAEPETGGLSYQELWELARELATPEPDIAPELLERAHRARERVEELNVAGSRGPMIAIAVALLVGGVIGILLGHMVPGVLALVVGGGLLGWSLYKSGDSARVAALEELHRAETALGSQRHAAEAAAARQRAARERAEAVGLPTDPSAVQALANELIQASQSLAAFTTWERRRQTLIDYSAATDEALTTALRDRGAPVIGRLDDALEQYRQACEDRRQAAEAANRRSDLERMLLAREQTERAAAKAARRRTLASDRLRAIAERCGISSEDEESIVQGLHLWQSERAERLSEQDVALRGWAELERLLNGRTLAELKAMTNRRREEFERLLAQVNPALLTMVVLEDDVEAQIDRLNREASDASTEYDELRGQAQERARTLVSVAEAEEELAAAEAELSRVRQLERTLKLTQEYLRQAQDRAHRDIAPVLATSVRRWLPMVSSNRYTDVRVNPQTLKVQVSGDGRRWRDATRLSHGTAEQVYLLLRTAMAEHLIKSDERCPLVLDDVTVQSDAERTKAILNVLHALSHERQIILFSQELDVLTWAEANLQDPADQVIRLDPAEIGI